MSSAHALPHPAPYTVYDLLDMPDDGNRYEVIEGSLLVSPAPTQLHQVIADSIRDVLRAAAPKDVRVVTGVGLRCREDRNGRVPDVLVGPRSDLRANPVVEASDALAVVEVVSPGSAYQDRRQKVEEYANAGIPVYWRVEIDSFPDQLRTEQPPVVLVHELRNGQYVVVDRLSAGITGSTMLPYPVEFDPADLLD